MSSQKIVSSGKTVKIKKSSSMSDELIIDAPLFSSTWDNRHFYVNGALELEGVTLKGGKTVSSFVCIVVKYSYICD